MSWDEKAACRDLPGEVFFPVGRTDSPARAEAVLLAQSVCFAKCKVRLDCARHAVSAGISHGIIAGIDLGDIATGTRATELHAERMNELRRLAEVPA